MPTRTTHILGISCFYHDAAACLVADGEIVAAAEEERFTRRKHDPSFPSNAAAFCLAQGGIDGTRLDHVVFYEKPFVKFERIVESILATAPRGGRTFARAVPLWAKEKLFLPEIVARETGYPGRCLFTGHHEAHAASAFFPSPFPDAAFLTLDGVGEWATAAWGTGRGSELAQCGELLFPHSLGMLYSAFTGYLGFEVNSGEYKVMGLAPYGEPAYADRIRSELMDLKADGSFRLNMEYFEYLAGVTMTGKRFERLLGGPPRAPGGEITRRHMDIARSVQEITEEIVLRMARHVRRETGMTRLCLAGGVALNCRANGRLLREGIFDEVWVQPAAGDAAGALGAALLVWHRRLGSPRRPGKRDSQRGSLLGPGFRDKEIASFLARKGVPYRNPGRDGLPGEVARLLADGKVVGWFQGRMEFGPRALGSRSILADPRPPGMHSRLNREVKNRESFRPFAPAVLKEHAGEWFETEGESPYMSFTFPVRAGKRREISAAEGPPVQEAIRVPPSDVPAVTHVDFSSRVQTVAREENPLFHDLIDAFRRRTGCPVLVNTSFNVRGEPIVCTPQDAFDCFLGTGIDNLVLGPFLLDKREMPAQLPGGGGRPPDPPSRETRASGVPLAMGIGLIAALQLLRGRQGMALALGVAGVMILLLGVFLPGALRPVRRASAWLAARIVRAFTLLLLGAVFYLLVTPVAVAIRRFRRDPLRRAYEPAAGSYWESGRAGTWSADRYERMY